MNQTVVALGMFDGVHKGHQALLRRAAEIAHANGDIAVAFTYDNHPKELFSGAFPYLCTKEQREKLIRLTGCDRMDSVPFDAAFAAMEPEQFTDWLSTRYTGGISALVAGYDYRFGAKAKGDTTLLGTLCKARGIALSVIDEVKVDGATCSSTRIREAIREGDTALAERMLGRPYTLSGEVVHAKALGRQFDCPTANLDAGMQLLPKDGVYATELTFEGKRYDAVTNVGTNPTVGGHARTVETHAIGESLDLYGKRVEVAFIKRLRDEKKFDSKDLLFAQIRTDAETAKKVCEERKKSVYNSEPLC
ncbi:MAG: bifunctional riboflavin kinase/FAD synthetase [Clostridia bacterium]|nr:bifunctional riboflavin kinase/FAD synthetase [Clostridia bacterium]